MLNTNFIIMITPRNLLTVSKEFNQRNDNMKIHHILKF